VESKGSSRRRYARFIQRAMQLRLISLQCEQRCGFFRQYLDQRRPGNSAGDSNLDSAKFGRLQSYSHFLATIAGFCQRQ
jgi:hypothetical protein